MKPAVTIKSKWDKLHLWSTNTHMWVFVDGRMFVINEAEYEHKKDNFKKEIYEKDFINKAKVKIK